MASVSFSGLGKVYPDGTRAVSDLNVEIEDGEFMILVGPSGCGKTTALRMAAGLEEVTDGEIRIDGEVVNTLESRKRDIAMVFQSYALYPHMTVFENMAFPLRCRRLPKQEVRERVERTAAMLGLKEQLRRRPRTLSGGQRQRVAMGRAIVRQPKLFLMDEPLSNLDAKLRVQMRADIARLQHELEVTTVYVTHDQVEAMTMGDRIAVLRKGVLQQIGPPQELYDRPANLFVGTFIGSPAMNLFRAAIDRNCDGLAARIDGQHVALANGSASPAALASYVGREVAVGVRPEHLTDAALGDRDAPRVSAPVTLVEALGSERLVHLELGAKPILTEEVLEIAQDTDAAVAETLADGAGSGAVPIVARFDTRSRPEAGTTAEVAVDTANLHIFDLETGLAIT
jgi:multiple sugar transport system ATP-binding protein